MKYFKIRMTSEEDKRETGNRNVLNMFLGQIRREIEEDGE